MRAGLDSKPYANQHAALMEDAYGWADFWSIALGKLGYEADEVVSNAEAMQKAWAREHDLRYDENNWLFEITTAQIKAFRPDVLFVNDYLTYNADYLRELKSECSFIRLVLGWCGAPYGDASVFDEYDIVLSSVPELVTTFRSAGHRCEHINHAFDPRILGRIGECNTTVDFSFVGTIAKKNKFHNSREILLLKLLAQTPLQIWIDTHSPSLQERGNVLIRQWAFDAVQAASRVGVPNATLEALPISRKVRQWNARPALSPKVDSRISKVAKPPLFGLKMFQQLQCSRVTLNTHIDISATHASNMRLYEATGVGGCLLTDTKSNLRDLFEPDVEVVTYNNWEECVEKLNYLLAHESERQAIAQAGQRRTLRDHNFAARATQLDQIIKSW
jgi:spore maturation protein CgeB